MTVKDKKSDEKLVIFLCWAAYTAAYIGSNYRNIPAFVILILILFLKPNGLFGKKTLKKV